MGHHGWLLEPNLGQTSLLGRPTAPSVVGACRQFQADLDWGLCWRNSGDLISNTSNMKPR